MKQRSYTIQEKREALMKLGVGVSLAAIAREVDVPESTLRDWRAKSDASFAYEGHPDQQDHE
ncbi:hypothetical protein PINS_up018847, partial [Pythium insidiosum]